MNDSGNPKEYALANCARLRMLRRLRDLTLQNMSRRTGIQVNVLGSFERGNLYGISDARIRTILLAYKELEL